ncbi:MAG: NADH:flavin oxidoreductase [Bryobacteraceae bacterium]|nr:NADH:flavin oxidoreductase [Bryobacteraceae bacterium]
MSDMIFKPLEFRTLKVKNRVFRSNMSGRFDNYDGSGNPARINWETRFARGGVGAVISSFVPVHGRGRILPNYAMMDADDKIPFWREVGKRVHEFDCRFILQLSHGGRQRDITGIEYPESWSSTSKPDPLHGFEARAMTENEIGQVVQQFGQAAQRAQQAGLDGVELHGANGYLITQFLSSAINDRKDGYGGQLENRARFLLEIVRSIRQRCGRDFHLQMKISATENNNAMVLREERGNTIADSVQVCKWLETEGVDAIHVSNGSYFPHPRNPAGDLPVDEFLRVYDSMISSGTKTLRNFLILRNDLTGRLFKRQWEKERGTVIEGLNLPDSAAIKQAVSIPVICTGGFQTASVIRAAISSGQCDAVSIARPLIANPDLVKMFERGLDRPPVPCTYCNKCLVTVVENPLGCYDETRFITREAMIRDIMSVFDPPPYK